MEDAVVASMMSTKTNIKHAELQSWNQRQSKDRYASMHICLRRITFQDWIASLLVLLPIILPFFLLHWGFKRPKGRFRLILILTRVIWLTKLVCFPNISHFIEPLNCITYSSKRLLQLFFFIKERFRCYIYVMLMRNRLVFLECLTFNVPLINPSQVSVTLLPSRCFN